MACLYAMEFFLIMKAQGEVRLLLQKITRALARIEARSEDCSYLGDIDSLRDLRHARDYVEMQWLMLQQKTPEDFVIATSRKESVSKFIELSAQALGWNKDKEKPQITW